MARHAFIIGGTGQIGRATSIELLNRGWRVTLTSRGKRPADNDLVARGARIITLDREQPSALATALADGADAVIDTIAYTAAHADQLLDVQGDVGAFVAISSSSVYRDSAGRTLNQAGELGFPNFPEPITEAQATVDPGPQTYSTRKVALERRLLDRATKPVTILRPCAIHGTHTVHPREWWFVKRMLDRRKIIPVAYRGQSRFHTSATANIASLIAVALDHPGTRIFNSADPVALNVAEIGAVIAKHMNYEGSILPLDIGNDNGHEGIGDTPWSAPLPHVLNTDAASALGYKPATTYENAVGEVCDWLVATHGPDWRVDFPVLAGYPVDLFDYSAEDEYFASAG